MRARRWGRGAGSEIRFEREVTGHAQGATRRMNRAARRKVADSTLWVWGFSTVQS